MSDITEASNSHQTDACLDGSEFVPQKSHKSAIILMPPENVWTQIQEVRSKHDKAYERWMPHINMIYPFLADANDGKVFSDASSLATQALSSFKPFKVKFTQDSFRYFKHKKSGTLWLKPEVVNHSVNEVAGAQASSNKTTPALDDYEDQHPVVIDIQKSLCGVFKQCNDLNLRSDRGFTPHLSLGQFSAREVGPFVDNLRKNWADIEFEVKELYMISRKDFNDPFHIRHSVLLGQHLECFVSHQ